MSASHTVLRRLLPLLPREGRLIDRMRFRVDIDDPTVSLATDLRYPGRPVLVAFAGVIGKMGMPTFEFFNITKGLRINRIFVRDLDRLWYQRGIGELGEDLPSAALGLRSVIDTVGPSRIVTVGNSGGGYAAIAFGALLEADEVLAISPQTVLGRVEAVRYRESTWAHVTERLQAAGGPDERYADLAQMLTFSSFRPSCHVHYAAANEIDALHAEHLSGVPGVELHPHQHHDHNVITRLRDEGKLRHLLVAHLEARPPAPARRPAAGAASA
jgi:hypothetical protein